LTVLVSLDTPVVPEWSVYVAYWSLSASLVITAVSHYNRDDWWSDISWRWNNRDGLVGSDGLVTNLIFSPCAVWLARVSARADILSTLTLRGVISTTIPLRSILKVRDSATFPIEVLFPIEVAHAASGLIGNLSDRHTVNYIGRI
jgi:hypothetical protein